MAYPGALPTVNVHHIGKYRWHSVDREITVSSDINTLRSELQALGERDVLRINIRGSMALMDAETIGTLVEETRARVRALRVDTAGVKVLPTEDDLAALGARSGYLANVVKRLRDLQSDDSQATTASEALLLLAQLQREAGQA